MKKLKGRQIDLTQGSILKGLTIFAIPFLFGNLFQEFYTIADSMIVGNFCSASALAAIGSAENPSKILLNIFMGFSTATTILISQAYGAKDTGKMSDTTATSNAFLIYASVPLALLGILAAPFVLRLIRVEEGETMRNAMIYMRILLLGTPAMLGYNQNAGILRGLGDSESPILFLVISSILNVLLDLLLVGPFHLGVGGAAAATVIAQGMSWILSIGYIRKVYPWLNFRLFTGKPDISCLKDILYLGIPLGLSGTVFTLGHTIVAGIINGYGTTVMAGYTCAKRLDSLAVMPVHSIGNSASAFTGQNAGAGKNDRVKKGIRVALVMGFVTNMVLCGLVYVFRGPLTGLFTHDTAVMEAAQLYIIIAMPLYWAYALFNTMNGALNGLKEVVVPTASAMIMFWVVRLPMMFIFNMSGNLELVYLAFPISWIFGMVISCGYYLTGRWKRHLAQPGG